MIYNWSILMKVKKRPKEDTLGKKKVLSAERNGRNRKTGRIEEMKGDEEKDKAGGRGEREKGWMEREQRRRKREEQGGRKEERGRQRQGEEGTGWMKRGGKGGRGRRWMRKGGKGGRREEEEGGRERDE